LFTVKITGTGLLFLVIFVFREIIHSLSNLETRHLNWFVN